MRPWFTFKAAPSECNFSSPKFNYNDEPMDVITTLKTILSPPQGIWLGLLGAECPAFHTEASNQPDNRGQKASSSQWISSFCQRRQL
mmetsp:Transcript_35878/g.55964  ORF Transcript_35878/g.55964 Transcript_35878/m.55964 type:complete len:87 (-) Transcript_35878:416-676(-)